MLQLAGGNFDCGQRDQHLAAAQNVTRRARAFRCAAIPKIASADFWPLGVKKILRVPAAAVAMISSSSAERWRQQ